MAHILDRRCACVQDLVENPRERDNLEHLVIDGRIILKRISKKWIVGCGLD
jgi:UTP-glucose-1-phosphate uridylyltransferase